MVVDVVVAQNDCEPACSEPCVAGVDQSGDGGEEVAPPGEAGAVVLPKAVPVELGVVGEGEGGVVRSFAKGILAWRILG